MRRILGVVIAFALVVALLGVLDVVGFRYPRVVENEPLLSPVAVADVTDGRISLADGRDFKVTPADDLTGKIRKSGNQIDVEQVDGEALIYVKRRGWLCGTPWTQLIRIPLIADDVEINRRDLLDARVQAVPAGS
jgi:hypothetical protein